MSTRCPINSSLSLCSFTKCVVESASLILQMPLQVYDTFVDEEDRMIRKRKAMIERVFEGCHFSTRPVLFESFKEEPVVWQTQIAKKGSIPDKVYIIFQGLLKVSVTQAKANTKRETPLMLQRKPPLTRPIKILGPDHLIGLEEAKNRCEFDYDVFVEEKDTLLYSIDAGFLFALASQDYGLFKRINHKLEESKVSFKKTINQPIETETGADRTEKREKVPALLPDPTLSEERRNSKELEGQFNVELRSKKVEEINSLLKAKETTLKQKEVLKNRSKDDMSSKQARQYKRYINERDSINLRKKKLFSDSLRQDHFEKYKSMDLRETQLTATYTESLAMTNLRSAFSRHRSVQRPLQLEKCELDGESDLTSLQYESRPKSCLFYSIQGQVGDGKLHREAARDIMSKILHKNFSINCLDIDAKKEMLRHPLTFLKGKLSKTNYHINHQERPLSKLISPTKAKSVWDPRRKLFRKTEAATRLEFTKSFGAVPQSDTSGHEPSNLHLENSFYIGRKLNEQLFR